MSYQKQKGCTSSIPESSDSEDFELHGGGYQKKKKIQKVAGRNQDDQEGLYTSLNKKKKQVAKEIKRIREQNRRASHKEYVTKLQQQIQEKQAQIQNLTTRIKQLELQLQSKVCHKCGNDPTIADVSVSNVSPLPSSLHPASLIEGQGEALMKDIGGIGAMEEEEEYDFDDSFRRIGDDSSLRICFGNKNLLFFLVTMCCLTIGSIADNPEMFLEPIHPFMVKSEMHFLLAHEKLENFHSFTAIRPKIQQDWGQLHSKSVSSAPQLDQNISRVSDLLNIRVLLLKMLPTSLQFLTTIKDPAQMLFSIGTNQLFHRLLDGRHYYI